MNRIVVCGLVVVALAACAPGGDVVPSVATSPLPVTNPPPSLVAPTIQVELSATPALQSTATVAPSCNPIKIMPLGDSITYGEGIPSYGGYRNLLGALLESEGIQFDFVGSQQSGGEALADPDNEGHPGWRISNVRKAIAEEGWLETYQPDIILLHIGSNDLLNTTPKKQPYTNLAATSEDLSGLLDDILTRLPETHIIVARIVRLRWGSDSNHVYFNNAIPEIVASRGGQVSVVDMQDILIRSDFVTLYHPNPRGYDKMAHAWLNAILALDLGKCAP
ncbi:MAG: SGNH hydrolase [Chloroflexi bacterium]|nr:SGNH hydrolase [Chloroflexota bacterium]